MLSQIWTRIKDRLNKLGSVLVVDLTVRVVILILIQLGIFLMDIFLPFGVATIVAYIAIVQLTLWLPKTRHTIYAASANSVFIIAGVFLSFQEESLTYALFNRGLALAAVWVSAIFVLRYERAILKIGESESFKLLFESAGEGLIIVNKWGNIISVNPELASMFGYPEEELEGMNLKELSPERYWDRYEKFKRNYFQSPEIIHIGEAPGKETFYGLRKDGTEFPVEIGVGYYKTVDEILTIIFVADITERKEAEQQILESKQWLTNFMDSSPAYISILDENLKIVDCNQPMLEVFNASSKEEVIGKHLAELYPRIQESQQLEKYESVLKTGEAVDFSEEVEHPLFGHKYFDIHVFKAGKGLGSIIEDVTAEKLAERKITESRERLTNFIDSTNSYITILDEHLNIIDCNKPILKMFNVKNKEEVIGRPLVALAPEIATSGQLEKYKQVIQSGERQEYEQEVEHPLLGHKYFNIRIFNADSGVGSIIDDITEKRQAEQKLKESEEKYRDLFENANDLIQSVDPEGKILYVNKAWKKALGYSDEDIAKTNIFDVFHPDCHDHCKQIFKELIEGNPKDNIEIEFLTKDGRKIFTEGSVSIRKKEGKIISTRGIFRDVTESRKATEQLKESEEKLRLIIENATDIITILEEDGTVRFSSPAIERILGYKPAERKGISVFNNMHPDDVPKVKEIFSIGLKEPGSTQSIEYRFQTKTGEWRYLESKGIFLHENPEINGIIIVTRDISERKELRLKLEESEAELKALSENAPGYIMRLDKKGNIQYINKKMWHKEPEEIINNLITDYLDEEFREEFMRKLKETLKTGKPSTMEVKGFRPDHEIKWYENQMALLQNAKGDKEIEVLAIDITERKNAREALAKSEKDLKEANKFLDSILENIPHIVFVKDAMDLKYLHINKATEKALGTNRKEIIGSTAYDFLPKEEAEYLTKQDKQVIENKEILETPQESIKIKGEERIFHSKKIPILDEQKKPIYLLGISEDITDWIETQKALKLKDEQYRIIIEESNEGIYRCDFRGHFLYVNPAVIKITGYPAEELLEMKYTDLVQEGFKQKVRDFYEKQFYERKETTNFQFPIVTKPGDVKWIEQTVEMIFDPDKDKKWVQEFTAIAHDITARKKAEEELDEKLEQLNAILGTSNDAIISANEEGNIEYFNAAAQDMFGYSLEGIAGKPLTALMPDEYISRHEKGFEKFQKTHKPSILGKGPVEMKGKKKDGTVFPIELTLSTWQTAKGEFYTAIIRDVSKRKFLERRLQEHDIPIV